MLATKPIIVSLNTKMITAEAAPKAVKNFQTDVSVTIAKAPMTPAIQAKIINT